MARTRLEHRTIVVTGAASGMGRALAIRAARAGCAVVVTDVDEAGLAETERLVGDHVLARRLDVRDRDAHRALVDEVRTWAPHPLGAVFSNAGVTLSDTVADATPEDLQWVLDVNFWGVVHGTQAWLPWLLEQRTGAVVNTSSIFGIIAWPTQAAYNASKFAVRGFTESLRQELRGTGVQAISVHPGGVATSIVDNARFRVDDLGRTDHAELQKDFEKVARLSSDEAARIIWDGTERGRKRILVGADAAFGDLLQRVTPTRYDDVMRRIQPYVRR